MGTGRRGLRTQLAFLTELRKLWWELADEAAFPHRAEETVMGIGRRGLRIQLAFLTELKKLWWELADDASELSWPPSQS